LRKEQLTRWLWDERSRALRFFSPEALENPPAKNGGQLSVRLADCAHGKSGEQVVSQFFTLRCCAGLSRRLSPLAMIATMNRLTNQRRMLLAGLLVVLLSGVGWEVLVPKEATYRGKGLRYWLNEYEVNSLREVHEPFNKEPSARKERAEEAIRAIGTNGLPLLLKMITAKDSVFKQKFISLT
jgi:hypothetical protein